MTAISFYHLQGEALSIALARLLEKVSAQGHRVLVRVGSDDRLAELDDSLWSFRDDSFLPHDTQKDEGTESTPVLLSRAEEGNPNNADILVLVDDQPAADLSNFERCLYMFEGHDDDALAAARQRWKAYKDDKFDLGYWQQSEQGWQKKA